MITIRNKYFPFKRDYINLFGVLYIKKGASVDTKSRHIEMIRTVQIQEFMAAGFLCSAILIFFGYWWITLLVTLFSYYIWYGVEKLYKRIKYGSEGYYKLSLDREAYLNASDFGYLDKRKRWAWLKYL